MIVVDANFLVLLLDPNAMPHIDQGHARVTEFIRACSKEIIIPSPAISEVIAGRLDRVSEIMGIFRKQRIFHIQPFDEVISIETGHIIRRMFDNTPTESRPQGWRIMMKYDAMIAATAIVRGASEIITGDGDFRPLLDGSSVKITKPGDLPLPPRQGGLFDVIEDAEKGQN